MSTCASATPKCNPPPSSAKRSQPRGSPSITGLSQDRERAGQSGGRWDKVKRDARNGRGAAKIQNVKTLHISWWGWLLARLFVGPLNPCRSKRKGYLHYAMGQLRQMGKQFYDTDIHVEVLSEQLVGDYSHVTMRSVPSSACGQATSLLASRASASWLMLRSPLSHTADPLCGPAG